MHIPAQSSVAMNSRMITTTAADMHSDSVESSGRTPPMESFIGSFEPRPSGFTPFPDTVSIHMRRTGDSPDLTDEEGTVFSNPETDFKGCSVYRSTDRAIHPKASRYPLNREKSRHSSTDGDIDDISDTELSPFSYSDERAKTTMIPRRTLDGLFLICEALDTKERSDSISYDSTTSSIEDSGFRMPVSDSPMSITTPQSITQVTSAVFDKKTNLSLSYASTASALDSGAPTLNYGHFPLSTLFDAAEALLPSGTASINALDGSKNGFNRPSGMGGGITCKLKKKVQQRPRKSNGGSAGNISGRGGKSGAQSIDSKKRKRDSDRTLSNKKRYDAGEKLAIVVSHS